MSSYELNSTAKANEALAAIGGTGFGSNSIQLLKQLVVAAGVYRSNQFVGPLDAFTAGLAGTWSVARRLLTSYEGALIRVRRSNDNAEQDIGYTSAGELDAAALASFVGANSAFVRTVYDQSGNARNFAQTTAASQPRIVNAGTMETNEGKPSMLGILANSTSLTCSSFAARTWIATGRLLTPMDFPGLLTGVTTNIILIGGAASFSAFPPTPSGYSYFVNTVNETADLTPFCREATRVLTVTANSATEAWQWGSERNVPGRSFNGHMQELAIYSTIPTFRANVEQIMMDYLGL